MGEQGALSPGSPGLRDGVRGKRERRGGEGGEGERSRDMRHWVDNVRKGCMGEGEAVEGLKERGGETERDTRKQRRENRETQTPRDTPCLSPLPQLEQWAQCLSQQLAPRVLGMLRVTCMSPGDMQAHESQEAIRGVDVTWASFLISGEDREAQRGQ